LNWGLYSRDNNVGLNRPSIASIFTSNGHERTYSRVMDHVL